MDHQWPTARLQWSVHNLLNPSVNKSTVKRRKTLQNGGECPHPLITSNVKLAMNKTNFPLTSEIIGVSPHPQLHLHLNSEWCTHSIPPGSYYAGRGVVGPQCEGECLVGVKADISWGLKVWVQYHGVLNLQVGILGPQCVGRSNMDVEVGVSSASRRLGYQSAHRSIVGFQGVGGSFMEVLCRLRVVQAGVLQTLSVQMVAVSWYITVQVSVNRLSHGFSVCRWESWGPNIQVEVC